MRICRRVKSIPKVCLSSGNDTARTCGVSLALVVMVFLLRSFDVAESRSRWWAVESVTLYKGHFPTNDFVILPYVSTLAMVPRHDLGDTVTWLCI